jgi:hypothetical protein
VKVRNTGNVGEHVQIRVAWQQFGQAPRPPVGLSGRADSPVRRTVNHDRDAGQQEHHDFNMGGAIKLSLVHTYGQAHA